MAAVSTPPPAGLQRWLQRLSERDMPVLADTVEQLCTSTDDHSASASDLAAVVLRDAAMTSGVLKIANSAYYNAGGFEINTISRAVIVLGFDTVRSIGLSLAVIDTFLRGKPRSRVIDLMRQAVYAAVQAKVIAQHSQDPAPEKVFIAALLYRLGEMAFWSFALPREAEALGRALSVPDRSPQQAELEVLGCTLRQLTAGLAKQWHLGETLESSLQAGKTPAGRSASVILGHELEAAVREHGWDSPAVKRITERIAAHTKVSQERAGEIIASSRTELKRAADAFGMSIDLESGAGGSVVTPAVAAPRQPDPMLQLKILRELSSVLDRKPDIQLVLDMVMEGIYRGIAMDRALLAVLSPDRKSLRVKYVLGDSDSKLADCFRVFLDAPEAEMARMVLTQQKSIWAEQLPPGLKPKLLTKALTERLAGDFLIGPLVVRGRDIGLIYADCRLSGQPLKADTFESFRHFIEQANLSLEHLTRR